MAGRRLAVSTRIVVDVEASRNLCSGHGQSSLPLTGCCWFQAPPQACMSSLAGPAPRLAATVSQQCTVCVLLIGFLVRRLPRTPTPHHMILRWLRRQLWPCRTCSSRNLRNNFARPLRSAYAREKCVWVSASVVHAVLCRLPRIQHELHAIAQVFRHTALTHHRHHDPGHTYEPRGHPLPPSVALRGRHKAKYHHADVLASKHAVQEV